MKASLLEKIKAYQEMAAKGTLPPALPLQGAEAEDGLSKVLRTQKDADEFFAEVDRLVKAAREARSR